MNFRVLAGSMSSYFYCAMVGKLPSSSLRCAYLRYYLKSLGQDSSIQMGCRFLNGQKVIIGDRNVINFGCLFDGRHYTIKTGSDVSIGPEAAILTLGHDPQSPHFGDKGGDVVIGNHVWIAYRAVILPGITIGDGAVVGAGSVVTKDVEPYTVVAGNPARVIKKRDNPMSYQLDYQPFLI